MIVSILLVVMMAAVLQWELGLGDPGPVIAGLALTPYNLTHGIQPMHGVPTVLTPLTSIFVHAGPSHLIGNALVLIAAGPLIERRCGPLRFLEFFLACGVAGGLAQTAAFPGSDLPLVGASGAIAGVLGAIAVRDPLARVFGVPVVVPILLWAGVQFLNGTAPVELGVGSAQHNPVAYLAHVGGFLTGVLTIPLFERRERVL